MSDVLNEREQQEVFSVLEMENIQAITLSFCSMAEFAKFWVRFGDLIDGRAGFLRLCRLAGSTFTQVEKTLSNIDSILWDSHDWYMAIDFFVKELMSNPLVRDLRPLALEAIETSRYCDINTQTVQKRSLKKNS